MSSARKTGAFGVMEQSQPEMRRVLMMVLRQSCNVAGNELWV